MSERDIAESVEKWDAFEAWKTSQANETQASHDSRINKWMIFTHSKAKMKLICEFPSNARLAKISALNYETG